MSEELYEDGSTNFRLLNVSAIYDEDGSIKFINDSLSSSNFDGYIFSTNASVGVTQITAGQSIGIQSSTSSVLNFYPIIKVEAEDPVLTSPYTGAHYIYYLDNNETFTSSYSSSAASVIIRYDDWEGKNLGTSGWTITSGGNAIFSNIAARGRIEATSGFIGDAYSGWEIGANLLSNASVGLYAPSAFSSAEIAIFSGSPFTGRATAPFRVNYGGQMNATGASISGALTATTLNVGGSAGITYDGSVVTIGSSVTILGTTTTDSLQVGASPILLKIANNVEGTNDGIYIDPYNFWYSDGKFSVGGSANSACWNGTALSVKGNIIATSGSFSGALTASVGTIGGFTLAGNQLSASQVTISSSGGLRLGATNQFSVDQSGNLVATSASITGNITANSGTFTGSISAQHITASTGSIAGFALANNQMSTASVIVSSSGGFRLGSPTVFSVDQFGNLVASTASITGRINATSGSFSGDITASAGRFVGALSVSSSGAIYAGTNVNSGQRTVLNASGLFGYHSSGIEAFALPVSGSPRLGTFTIIPTGIVSQSASNANMIYGNVDSSGSVTDGIVIRGSRISGASAAIYTVQNGVETSYASGNGFYVDENARFKLKGATGSLAFDGTDLYVSGNINATSGRFTGSVVAQHITASTGTVGGWTLSSSGLVGGSGTNSVGIISVPNSSSIAIFAGNATASAAPFQVTNLGKMTATNAEISGQITSASITSTYGEIAGWILSASALTGGSGTNTVGLVSTPQADNISIYAGSTTPSSAPFRVTKTGSVFATNATITGDITATNITASLGNVGGWNLSASTLTGNSASIFAAGEIRLGTGQNMVAISSTNTNRIWAGSAVSTTAPFRVSNTGFLTANGASITGDITAQSGTFTGSISAQNITASIGTVGGFLLSSTSLTASSTAATAVGISTGASAIFAGATSRTGDGAKFWVSNAGTLYAQAASIVGDSIINGTNIGNGGGNIPSNLRIGADALLGNTTGTANVALGDYAARTNRTGFGNVSVGASALFTASTSTNNVAIGSFAMAGTPSLSDVTFNVAVGAGALYKIANADYNVAIGASAMFANNFSDSSVAIGHRAMANSTTGLYSIGIGWEAMRDNNANYNIGIGNYALRTNDTGVDNIAIGQAALIANTSADRNIAIGKYALNSTNAQDNIGIGAYSGYSNTSGLFNIGIGSSALFSLSSGNRNIAVGLYSLSRINDGSNNISIGVASQYNLTSGVQNISLGSSAGFSLGSGTENVIIGTLSGRGITSGDFNVIIGDNAGTGITGGSNNIVLGSNAFTGVNGSNNTVIGKAAYNNATTGSANVALGYRAGTNHTSGNYTVYLGYEGTAVTTSSNVYIGAGTALGLRIDSAQNVIIPNDLTVDTNTLYVDSTNNRVGIGTTGPTNTLTVIGTASVSNTSKFGGDLTVLGSSNEFAVYDGSTYALRVIAGNGGATASIGSVRSNAVYERTTTTAANQNIDASFFFRRVVASSQQWKKDIVDLSLDESLQSVLNIRPVKFKFIDGYISEDDSRFNLDVPGFIAEEVNIASPIVADKEDGKPSDWNPKILIPMMVKVIQHQQTQIEELYARINQLEGGQ